MPSAAKRLISSNKSSNEYSIDVGETDKTFKAYFKVENFKMISDDYDVSSLSSLSLDGFVIAKPTTARAALTILQTAFLFDLVEHDFEIDSKLDTPC